jgi:Tfp pilus assembly protein PilN
LEIVGGSLINIIPEVPALELGDPSILRKKLDDERSNKIAMAVIGLGVVLLALVFGIGFALEPMIKGEEDRGNQLQAEIQNALASLEIVPVLKRKLFVKQTTFHNYQLSNLLIKLAQALPPDAWLNQVVIKSTADYKSLMVTVIGGAMSSDPLNNYVKELSTEAGQPPMTPSVTPKQDEQQRYFEFTLTNAPQSGASAGTPMSPASSSNPVPVGGAP